MGLQSVPSSTAAYHLLFSSLPWPPEKSRSFGIAPAEYSIQKRRRRLEGACGTIPPALADYLAPKPVKMVFNVLKAINTSIQSEKCLM